MAANFERVQSISRQAAADYSAAPPSGGQYRFCVVNASEVTSYTNPDNPGLWYGSNADPPAIPAGNVLVNTSAGADCIGILLGKAHAGEAVEVGVAGRLPIILGGTVTVGDALSSDGTGAAITHSSTNHILGQALSSGVAGDQIDMLFQPRGEA